ncbi:3'-5' exonuclease [Neodidymelliopsis sp. IMI 364377]|nr:3'-5' exonuclease [Neodidymelliopsis sp. IMI 364377]
MAPELSSNWKRLQAKLQASKPATPSKSQTSAEEQTSLKRKRSLKTNDKPTNGPRIFLNGAGKTTPHKSPVSRKRQKMEEPASVGASIKQHNVKILSRSTSTPQLRRTPLVTSEADAAVAEDVLTPHPDFPDIENEGVSETALPGKYVALDCEMVGVGPEPNRDSALARVSLVNYHGHQVYDSYVQMPPKVEVTDYRTAVSGIEPKHLRKDVARTFEEVRSDLKILLGGRILVGHAVKNDLDVLILKHDKRLMRDTSKFSKFRALAAKAGWTPGLKMLAQKLLGVEIQTGAHSSVEDARATMALFRLEKDEFEKEIRQKYGNVRVGVPAPEVEADGDEEKKKRNRKKSKKKKKH